MNWISIISLIISALTLIMVGVQLFINTKQKEIDRQVEVMIKESRRMQQELFKNVLGILEVDRELQYSKLLKEKDVLFHEVLNYRVGVWINLNRENSFSSELRSRCNNLSIWAASTLEASSDDNVSKYLEAANRDRQKVWILIDKYIEEEDKLIKSIISGKKLKAKK
ncbi:hypothetical protein [Clostridium beijerinckii]|uniref:hypothetical protein n=1 Tax=Clostridium beijerinckii TaxID=1520 RepID=UPI001F2F24C3|nr:hypothetical protein [Clostridium beijerinckii]